MTGTGGPRPAVLLLAEEVWGTTLHAMRSLAGRGAEVLVAVAGEGASIYGSSSFCRAAVDISPESPTGFCASAVAWVEAELGSPDRKVIVIPLSDRTLDFLDDNRELFGSRFVLAIPDAEVTGDLLDKRTSLVIAEKAGLSVPPWTELAPDDGAADLLRTHGRLLVRPARWTPPGPDYFKVRIVEDREALDRMRGSASGSAVPLVAQQYLDAPESAVEFAIVWRSEDGSATACCTGRKRRQSHRDGGVMVWGEAVELEDVRAATLRFLDESGFTGLGGIEFMRSPTGLQFIEFNPRLEAIHFLATTAGVDTVALEYEQRAGSPTPGTLPRQHEAGAWLGSAWLARLTSDRSYRLAALRDRIDWARLPARSRAVWTWQDPRPALGVSRRLAGRAGGAVLRRVSGGRRQ